VVGGGKPVHGTPLRYWPTTHDSSLIKQAGIEDSAALYFAAALGAAPIVNGPAPSGLVTAFTWFE
jgi:hypothetical protein